MTILEFCGLFIFIKLFMILESVVHPKLIQIIALDPLLVLVRIKESTDSLTTTLELILLCLRVGDVTWVVLFVCYWLRFFFSFRLAGASTIGVFQPLVILTV